MEFRRLCSHVGRYESSRIGTLMDVNVRTWYPSYHNEPDTESPRLILEKSEYDALVSSSCPLALHSVSCQVLVSKLFASPRVCILLVLPVVDPALLIE
jgi:hypothetical protein